MIFTVKRPTENLHEHYVICKAFQQIINDAAYVSEGEYKVL